MRAPRFVLFLLSIAIGVGLGLVYGWMINPQPYANLKPDTLRADYKADYILMTATVFRKDANLGQAVRRLAILEDKPADILVAEALLTARDLKYTPADIETLATLAQALQSPGTVVTPGATGTPETIPTVGTVEVPAETATPSQPAEAETPVDSSSPSVEATP
jgi:hypothetical protein